MSEDLKLHTKKEVEAEIVANTESEDLKAVDLEEEKLKKQADEVIEELLSFEENDEAAKEKSRASIETLALELQKKAVLNSDKLKDPVRKMSVRSKEGSKDANALVDLRVQVEALDPARFDFEAGWATRLLGYIPGIGSPLKRYFSRYESSQTVIDSIITSLENGREQLKRDNITLTDDQKKMRESTTKLRKAIKLAQIIDAKLENKVQNEILQDDPKYAFIKEELLFPLRQRILDLQQQLAVNQQGVLAMEIIIRNNKELIRGVNRSLNVTIHALRVAVTVALALADQKVVLEKVQALSETTSELIANTAERLKTQGTEIHKMASSSKLDMESLKSAFSDINEALADISTFRQKALPEMAANVAELDELTEEAEETIKVKEKANKNKGYIPIEID